MSRRILIQWHHSFGCLPAPSGTQNSNGFLWCSEEETEDPTGCRWGNSDAMHSNPSFSVEVRDS